MSTAKLETLSRADDPAARLRLRLGAIVAEFPRTVFASSLGAEDMVITDVILRSGLPIGIFTLDTGRLPPQTLALIAEVSRHYGHALRVIRPDAAEVAEYVATHGQNAFYESVALRQRCCHLRKVRPLARALTGCEAWVTGLRRGQSVTRSELPLREHDAAHGIEKFNPLADWRENEVWAYLRAERVPCNALHDLGYPSIGCEPCTRAIRPGEDIRAGRWWWEARDSKECGLHVSAAPGPATAPEAPSQRRRET